MGVYSQNRTNLGNYSGEEIVADENYVGQVGSALCLIESYENDLALFSAVIQQDIQEAAGIIAVGESAYFESGEVQALQEANIQAFADKLIQYIKMAWKKIKGVFDSIITRIGAFITRDGKKLVSKYKDKVIGKDLSKMKYKWAAGKGGDSKLDGDKFRGVKDAKGALDKLVAEGVENGSAADYAKKADELGDRDKAMAAALNMSGATFSSCAKDYHEANFEASEETTGLSSDRLKLIMDWLTNGATTIEPIKKDNKAADQIYSDMLRTVDKAKREVSGKLSTDNTMTTTDVSGHTLKSMSNSDTGIKRLNALHKAIATAQEVMNRIVAAKMSDYKFMMAQCGRVFRQAAAYNPKSVKEDAILFDAIGEAAEYEILSEI